MLKRFFTRIYRTIAKYLSIWLGWGVAKDFFQDCRKIDDKLGRREFLATQKERYRENLAREEAVRAMSFEDVLAGWGIHTQEALDAAVLANRRARWAGILLALVFGALCFWQLFISGQPAWWKTLHGIAGFSFFIAGLLRWATAAWRLWMFRNRAFVPFAGWLTQLGKAPRRAGRQ